MGSLWRGSRTLFLFLSFIGLISIAFIVTSSAGQATHQKKFTKCRFWTNQDLPCTQVVKGWPDKEGEEIEQPSITDENGKSAEYIAKWQRPRSVHIHGLTAKPWHSAEELGFAKLLEDRHEQIRDELLSLMSLQSFGGMFPVDGQKLSEFNYWKLYHFAYNGRSCHANFDSCPITVQTLKEIDAMTNGVFNMTIGLTTFSILEPSTHIQKHCGPNNLRIRCHLGLITPPNAFLRVGDEIRSWEKGKTFCFDDSFEHEAWNNDTTVRAILMFDLWHYDFSKDHVKALIQQFPATTTEGCGQIMLGGTAKVLSVMTYYLIRVLGLLALLFVGWWLLKPYWGNNNNNNTHNTRRDNTAVDSQKEKKGQEDTTVMPSSTPGTTTPTLNNRKKRKDGHTEIPKAD